MKIKRAVSAIILFFFTTSALAQDASIIVIMKDFTTHQGKFADLKNYTIIVIKKNKTLSLELSEVMFVIDAKKDVVIYPKESNLDENIMDYSEREFEVYQLNTKLDAMKETRKELAGIKTSLQTMMIFVFVVMVGGVVAATQLSGK